jgi:pimeloyl-ACP methyl ester carboxylesterase
LRIDRAVILAGTELGAGSPVALLHGLFGAAVNFGSLQKRLAERHRVISIDLRNHGASPHTPHMSYPAMAEDVLETLRSLGALPCALIGHSMGGKVAMAAALEAPGAISRLLVADIAPVTYPPLYRGYAAAMAAIPLTPELTRVAADRALAATVENPAVRAFLLQNLRFGATPGWRIGLDAIAAGLAQIEGWPDLDENAYLGPTLFVAGARSDYILPEHRPLIRTLFPAAKFAVLKNAGHWLHADNPEGFLSLVDAFLA